MKNGSLILLIVLNEATLPIVDIFKFYSSLIDLSYFLERKNRPILLRKKIRGD